MAQNNEGGARGDVRQPDPANAAQDQDNLERQRQVERDREALQEQRDRVEATTPSDVKDRTIGEMVDDAERRSGTDLRSGADDQR